MVVGISRTLPWIVKGERTGWSMDSLCSGSPALVHGRPRTRHGLRRRRRQPQRRSVSPTTGATGCSSNFVLSAIATVGHRAAAHRHHRQREVRFCSVDLRQQMRATVCNHQRRVNRQQPCRSAWRRDSRRLQTTSSASVYNACARLWIPLFQYGEADVLRCRAMAGAYFPHRGRRLQYAPIPTSALSAPLKRRAMES